MSEKKRPTADAAPEAKAAMLRLVVDDAEEYERMLAEGHRELCIEYQPLLVALVDAQVMGRQLTGELAEARDYLKECPLCAESLESSSKALRELAAEDGQEEDEPFDPPQKDPPAEPQRPPGKVETWWLRFTKTRAGLISIVGVVLCVIALVGLFLQSGRQCAREDAQRDKRDADVSGTVRADAGPPAVVPDAALDPRSWLRKKGPLKFLFITLHLASQRQQTSRKALLEAQRELQKLTAGGMTPAPAALQRLRATVAAEAASLARLQGPLDRAAKFLPTAKDDGTIPDFAAQRAAAQTQLASTRRTQAHLTKLLTTLKKQL